MHEQQREHIATVMHVAERGIDAPRARAHDEIIRASWSRCVHEHRLDPTRMQDAVILPHERLREHQDRLDDFLHIARHGLETLYQQVAGMGYCVLLTDARGVTVDFIGDLQLDTSLRRAGLYLGADWSEEHAGTCGVGTALATGEALTVHLDDHFDATHIPLTCTTAPVFDAAGRVHAILDISALSSPAAKTSQHLALQLVKTYAQHIENASFLRQFRAHWIVKLAAAPQFLDLSPDYLLALDDAGCIVGHNRRAQQLLQRDDAPAVIGQAIESLLDVTLGELPVRFSAFRPAEQRAVTLRRNGRALFMHVAGPPARAAAKPAPVPRAEVPKPLAALSAGDPLLDRQVERAARLVDTTVPLLLTGETGSGKEFLAKAIHESSARRARAFVAVNCAALPEALIESELFGHLPGSFSGAAPRGKRGLIQEADGGTLFLDEIGDMPLPLQARLLRVLAEREVLPVGATRPVPVDIRVISATHRDLESLVHEGRFRDDLYYRLNGATLALPPLRERRDFDALVERLASRGPAPGSSVSPTALAVLRTHRWPGNLRELRNVIDYARAVCQQRRIEVDDLPDGLRQRPASPRIDPFEAAGDDARRLREALQTARWNVSAAARALGISRMTLYRHMQRHGITAPNHLPPGHA